MVPLTIRITALAAEFHFSIPSNDVSIAFVSDQGVDDRKDIGVSVRFANSSRRVGVILSKKHGVRPNGSEGEEVRKAESTRRESPGR